MDLRTPLAKVRGLGSAKEGTHHWLMQRFSAIALIGLVSWFSILITKSIKSGANILHVVDSPIQAVLFILLVTVAIYHGNLGIRVVVEDYVSCKFKKNLLIILSNFVAIFTSVAVVLALVYYHILSNLL